MNIKQIMQNKRSGFYVGAAGALLALVTLFIYLAMNSMYFTGWVVAGLIAGIVVFALAALFRLRFLYILSYACYMFAFYHFLVLEVEFRMDILRHRLYRLHRRHHRRFVHEAGKDGGLSPRTIRQARQTPGLFLFLYIKLVSFSIFSIYKYITERRRCGQQE